MSTKHRVYEALGIIEYEAGETITVNPGGGPMPVEVVDATPNDGPLVKSDAGLYFQALWGEVIEGSPSRPSEALLKAADDDLEVIVEECFDAITKSSWWMTTEDNPDLSKSPGIWRTDDQVPEYVREAIQQVIDQMDWDWDQFESLTPAEARRLEELVGETLTQPQGWSVGSLTEDIADEFNLTEHVARGVAADASHNVLAVSRMESYDAMEGSEEFEYRWTNPLDHRTTPVCEETIDEINDQGGAVSKPELKRILREKALKYEGTHEGGGTPDRVDVFEPHYRCRSVAVREV